MKMRSWTLLVLTGLMLAWSATAFAAATGSPNDPSRVLRQVTARGAHLELTVLDTKGRPVSGAKVSAVASDLSQIAAVTGPDGTAVLDGLPEESTGTIAQVKNLRSVNWNIRLEPGKLNHLIVKYDTLCYGLDPRKYRTPLVVKLPTEQPRFDQRWAPVHYSTSVWPFDREWPVEMGKVWPVKGDKFIDEAQQQLSYIPMDGRGQITQAYFRPWGEYQGAAKMPKATWWHISVYNYVNCDRKNPAQ